MTKISKDSLKPSTKKNILKEFWFTLGELKTRDLLAFIQDIFTPTEILMIAKRLAIIRALRQGIDYASIRQTYKVTDSTIAKMNNILARSNNDFRDVLDKLVKKEKRRWERIK